MYFNCNTDFKKEFGLDIYQWNILCLIYSFDAKGCDFYMSLNSISSLLDICKHTTIKSLKTLEEKGLITKEIRKNDKKNAGNIYKCTSKVKNFNKVSYDLVHKMNQPSACDAPLGSARDAHNNKIIINKLYNNKENKKFDNYSKNNRITIDELETMIELSERFS